MLKPYAKRIFLLEDIDSISLQAQCTLGSDSSNRQFLSTLLRATRYAVEHELTARQRECFTLHYEGRRTVSAIAAELALDKSTVSRHLSAARRRIQKHARYCMFAYYSGENAAEVFSKQSKPRRLV